MSETKILQFDRTDDKKKAREILKNWILDINIERLIQMTEFGLVGNINSVNGTNGTSHYFNRMKYTVAENEGEFDIISYFSIDKEKENDIIATTAISIDHIDNISGRVNKDKPDDVLDINILMSDGAEITINVIY